MGKILFLVYDVTFVRPYFRRSMNAIVKCHTISNLKKFQGSSLISLRQLLSAKHAKEDCNFKIEPCFNTYS